MLCKYSIDYLKWIKRNGTTATGATLRLGFRHKFRQWINIILSSAHLSMAINGFSYGYFTCTMRVRQGNPLSTLLFCLAEEVLSRSISKLGLYGTLELMSRNREVSVPSHTLYADDFLIFCKGKLSKHHYSQSVSQSVVHLLFSSFWAKF